MSKFTKLGFRFRQHEYADQIGRESHRHDDVQWQIEPQTHVLHDHGHRGRLHDSLQAHVNRTILKLNKPIYKYSCKKNEKTKKSFVFLFYFILLLIIEKKRKQQKNLILIKLF